MNGGDGAGEKSGDALVDEKPKASKEDHEDRARTVSSAALYVDVERLSAELRDTKRRLAEANAASAAADAENKKVFDEMLAAANEVADDLERERARCHRAEHELAKARATAHARDETRLGEIIEVKSELALAKASLRVEKEKRSQIPREKTVKTIKTIVHPATIRQTSIRQTPRTRRSMRAANANACVSSSARLARRWQRRRRARPRRAPPRRARARRRRSPRRRRARWRRAATESKTKLREDLRAARRTLRNAAARGDTEASAVCHEDDDEGAGYGVAVTGGRKRRSFVSFAKPFENGFERLFSATAIALVFFLSSLFVAGTFINSRRRDETLGYECAAQWRRTSGVLDEVLSGTLGAPFRRDDVCDVAAPPAT